MSVSEHVLWISCLTHENSVKNEQIKSRKNFPVNLSPDKPETGFLFFRVVEEILFFLFSFLFSFLTVWMHFQPASEKSQSKQVEYVFSLSANHFQPANPESLTSLKSPIRSLVVIVPKLKSLFSSFENLRGIVRPLKLSEVESLSKVNCLSMWKKKDSSSKIFQYKSVSFFLFNYAR